VKPIRLRDAVALADMEAFLTGSDVVRVPMPTAVYERACRIRAVHNYKLADAHRIARVPGTESVRARSLTLRVSLAHALLEAAKEVLLTRRCYAN
jgi:hypothetical protein